MTQTKTPPVASISRTTLRPSCAAVSSAKSMWKRTPSTAGAYLVGRLDDEVGEVRRALAELPPAAHLRPHERRAAAVNKRDHGDALGDGIAVGLVEALETPAVTPLLPRRLDQLVEDRVGEAPLVRAARRLEEQAEVVLRIRVAGQPARDSNRSRVDAGADGARLLFQPRPGRGGDPLSEDVPPATGDYVEDVVPDHHPRELERPVVAGPREALTRQVGVVAKCDAGRVALERRRHDRAGRHDEVRGAHRRQRLAVDRMRERASELEVAGHWMRGVEADVRRPRRRTEHGILTNCPRHQVTEARCVANQDGVGLTVLVP